MGTRSSCRSALAALATLPPGSGLNVVGPLPLRDCGLMEESHRRRHLLKPGMTGLWQVSGRSDLTFDDMVRLDLQYMENWSLQADAYILWRTVGAIVRSRGAY